MAATYLTVPFREKDEAKSLGARWDAARKRWYVPDGVALDGFERWLPDGAAAGPGALQNEPPHPPGARPDLFQSDSARVANRDERGHLTGLTGALVPGTADGALQSGSPGALSARDPAGEVTYGAPRGVPLSRLLTAVAGVVAQAFADPVWVTAEVLRAHVGGQGHVYLELSERDPQGRVVAKAQAMIWARTAQAILPPFEKATGMVLAAGIKLMVRAKPVFKAQFGFSLDIDAIDPAYTLGDLAAKKREIRERLQREGLFDRNRQLAPPWDYAFVLVVAPLAAAGLGDFDQEAKRLQRHGLCRFVYAHSRFQGEAAAAEILQAATGLLDAHRAAGPDALIFIRGGGAVNDLAWLDDYALARFICECPVPVLTGLGHERDSTMLDEVAHRRFDTPSKVVLGIEQRISQRAREAQERMASILATATDTLIRTRNALDRDLAGVRDAARVAVQHAHRQCERRLSEVQLGASHHRQRAATGARLAIDAVTQGARQQLATLRAGLPLLIGQVHAQAQTAMRDARGQTAQAMQAIGRDARRQVQDAARSAEALVREIAGQGPQKTLARGFAIVRDNDGRPLTQAAASAQAGMIQLEFQDGRIAADVRTDARPDLAPAPDSGTRP